MNPNVIQFQCTTCQSPLTVPLHLAGVTGPCPKCGATITSPSAPTMEALPAMPLPGSQQPAAASPPAPSWGAVNPLVQYTTEQPAPPPPQAVPQREQPASLPPAASPPPQPHGSLLENITGVRSGPLRSPGMPAAPASPPAESLKPSTGTLLPPRRSAGQTPASSLPPSGGSLMNQPSVGGAYPPPMPAGAGPQSSAWSQAGMTAGGPASQPVDDPMSAILQGRQPSAPLPARQPSGQLNPASSSAPSGFKSSPPINVTLSTGKKKSGRMLSSIFLVLVVSGLVAAGWHFREPIRDLAYRFFPDQFGEKSQPAEPAAESTQPESASIPQAIPPADTAASSMPFDPQSKNPDSQAVPPSDTNPGGLAVRPPEAPPAPGKDTAASGSTILGFTTPGGAVPAVIPDGLTQPTPGSPAANQETAKPAEALQSSIPRAMVVDDADAAAGGTASVSSASPPSLTVAPQIGAAPTESLLEVPKGLPMPPQPVESAATVQPPAAEPAVSASPESEKAVQALKAFFDAKTVEERARLVLGGDQLRQRMDSYYQITGEGALDVSEIKLRRFDPSPENGGGAHCVFNVASRHWPYPIPIMLQEENGMFKVDWLAFAEFKDDLLFKFLSDFQDMAARFHVSIRRTHYFDDDVPNRGELDCFEIQPPMPTFSGYVFVPKNTPLAEHLKKTIGWETLAGFAVVELKWKRLGEYKWVEMTALPQLNWYSVPAEAQAPPPAPVEGDPKKATADATARK